MNRAKKVLIAWPTIMINSGGADLKHEEDGIRIWVEPDGHTITVEVLDGEQGRWEILGEL